MTALGPTAREPSRRTPATSTQDRVQRLCSPVGTVRGRFSLSPSCVLRLAGADLPAPETMLDVPADHERDTRTDPEQPADRSDDDRVYPAEQALSTAADTRPEASPSVGWRQMLHEMDCETPYFDPDEVTSS